MRVALVRPPVVNLKNSPFGSTPGMPSNLAYLAAVLKERGHDVSVVDSYGLAPARFMPYKDRFEARGLTPAEAIALVEDGTQMIGVSVHCTLEHGNSIALVEESRRRFPAATIVVGGYHTTFCVEPFLEAGADFVLQGEGEHRLPLLIDTVEKGVRFDMDGIYGAGIESPRTPRVCPIEDLPFGSYDSIPLENYWKLHYAHGPVVSGKYINMFTSRGCPHACAFCQTPKMWGGKWMAKSPGRIVDEMDHYHDRYGVSDFHIQDENFSLSRSRTREFALELLRRGRRYTYCFPSGIKAETVGYEELLLLRRSGCCYFALSPESGSQRVLGLMNKSVDLDHVGDVVSWCSELGIKVNCNFVLGFPGETGADRRLTYSYIRKLAASGLDEVVTFMLTPLPETGVADLKPDDIEYEDINFSPTWRDNYRLITAARIWVYIQFSLIKLALHPGRLAGNVFSVLSRRFRMKGDMTVYRFFADFWDRYVRPVLGETRQRA